MSQSVILTSDVPGLGQIGELKKVKDGYARNYLIPNHLAILATNETIKRYEKKKEKILQEREKHLGVSKSLADKLSKVGLVFERPVGPGGKVFGSVSPSDIVSEISRQGVSIDKKSVLLSQSIRTVGDHVVRVRIHSQVSVDVPVKVVGLELNKGGEESPIETTAETQETESETVKV